MASEVSAHTEVPGGTGFAIFWVKIKAACQSKRAKRRGPQDAHACCFFVITEIPALIRCINVTEVGEDFAIYAHILHNRVDDGNRTKPHFAVSDLIPTRPQWTDCGRLEPAD